MTGRDIGSGEPIQNTASIDDEPFGVAWCAVGDLSADTVTVQSGTQNAATLTRRAHVDQLTYAASADQLSKLHDTVSSLVNVIYDQYGAAGASRAILRLCEIPVKPLGHRCRPHGTIDVGVTVPPAATDEDRDILIRCVHLAKTLLSARMTENGPDLGMAIATLTDETAIPVMTILVRHTARFINAILAAHGKAFDALAMVSAVADITAATRY